MTKTTIPHYLKTGFTSFTLLMLTACGGEDGDNGTAGPPGPPLEIPDLENVVYMADPTVNGFEEIFRVDTLGNNTLKLGATELLSGDIREFKVSPDNSLVAFSATDATGSRQLYVSPVDGDWRPFRVNGEMVAGGDVTHFEWSPDSEWLAYRADKEIDGKMELFGVRRDGTGQVKLNGELVTDGDLTTFFRWSPDSSRIAYVAVQDVAFQTEIYTVRTDGTDNVKLNGALASSGHVAPNDFEWAPDSSRVAFRAHQDEHNGYQLFTARPDGTNRVELSENLVADGEVELFGFQWSPDSNSLLYRADQETDDVFELYRVGADGTNRIKVSGSMTAEGDVSKYTFGWSPDGTRLYYQADKETDQVHELYAVDADGSDPAKLNGPLPTGGFVGAPEWSPDSSMIAYAGTEEDSDVRELYVVNADGTGRTRASGPMTSGGDVVHYVYWAPDGSRIAYRADQDTDGVIELYTARPDGSGQATVSPALPATGDVQSDIEWTPDSESMIFRADSSVDEVHEVYIAAADGSSVIRLSLPQTTGDGVTSFEPAL